MPFVFRLQPDVSLPGSTACKRCHAPLDGSTATVDGTEGYPTDILRKGDPLCRACEKNRAEAMSR